MRSSIVLLFASTALASPPADIAHRYLAAAPLKAPLEELGAPEISPVAGGFIARYRQTHRGLPVIGADQVLRVDSTGRVRRAGGATFALDGLDVSPKLDEHAAIAVVQKRAPVEGARAVLAIDPFAAGGPRLVWAVRSPPLPEILENAIYLIDAKSGQLLKRVDLIKYGKASVYLYNPVETPTPTAKDFPTGFDPTSADGTMEGPLLKSYDCIDTGEMKDLGAMFGNLSVHICTVTPEAKSATYDYTSYMPESEPFALPLNGCPNAMAGGSPQPLDEFSEQHMYWHVADAYSFFRGLFTDEGVSDFKLRAKPLALAVNLCTPDLSGGIGGNLAGPLVPFDNAFFSPGANNFVAQLLINGQDSIMFGQGSSYDFAYDADVIRHEFTHAVIDTLGQLVLVGAEDVWGLQDDQGAMNEGLADYFSSVEVGDPVLGEYAGRNIPGSNAEGAIRDLTNKDECGKDRWGEVHQDSQAFSASLWGARAAIAGDPKSAGFDPAKARLFDRAVLAAIKSFPGTVDMTGAAMAIGDEVTMHIDADAAQKTQDSFAAHKISPLCDRVIDYVDGTKKDFLGLDGTDSPYAPSGATRIPGYVQWKVAVPVGADSITATMTLNGQGGSFSGSGGLFGGAAAPKLSLIVGPTGMPIQWAVGTNGANDVASSAFSGTSGSITATLTRLTTGDNYVMIVNEGGGIIAENITFTTSCANPAGCAPPDMATPHSSSSGGCKCDLGGGGGLSFAPLVLIFGAGLLLRRRRFTGSR